MTCIVLLWRYVLLCLIQTKGQMTQQLAGRRHSTEPQICSIRPLNVSTQRLSNNSPQSVSVSTHDTVREIPIVYIRSSFATNEYVACQCDSVVLSHTWSSGVGAPHFSAMLGPPRARFLSLNSFTSVMTAVAASNSSTLLQAASRSCVLGGGAPGSLPAANIACNAGLSAFSASDTGLGVCQIHTALKTKSKTQRIVMAEQCKLQLCKQKLHKVHKDHSPEALGREAAVQELDQPWEEASRSFSRNPVATHSAHTHSA